jgi:hypothetical protein
MRRKYELPVLSFLLVEIFYGLEIIVLYIEWSLEKKCTRNNMSVMTYNVYLLIINLKLQSLYSAQIP